MNIFQRAYTYVLRKRKKSMILFFIFLTMCTCALLGLAIYNGTGEAEKSLRQSLGASFSVRDTSLNTADGKTITTSLVNQINDLGGIKEWNGINIFYLFTKELTLEAGSQSGSAEGWGQIPRFIGVEEGELSDYFDNHSFQIKEGRNITAKDSGKIVISEQVAKYSNLKVGDTISGEINEVLSGENQAAVGSSYSFEIVGIYEILGKQMNSGNLPENNIWENFIFTDNTTAREVLTTIAGNDTGIKDIFQYGATFYVDDPKDIYTIVDKLQKDSSISLDGLEITINDQQYQDSVVPLQKVSGLIKILILSILITSMLLLSLVLTIWTKSRLHEIGIFLSLGIKKGEIMLQHILESLVIGFAAFLLSLVISQGLVDKAGEQLFQQEDGSAQVTLSVGATEALEVVVLEGAIIMISIGMASLSIVRLNPKKIFSKMS